jgi:amino-acid racemase
MKTIGLIGGMSWESSLEYYRIINKKTRSILGGLHSAKSIMISVDFQEIEQLQHSNDWDTFTELMIGAAKKLEKANADLLVICTNTMHKMAIDIENNISIPLIHIADETAKVIRKSGLKKIGLLGTKFTMEQEFYKGRLTDSFGLDVLTPNEKDRDIVHSIIYKELVVGIFLDKSKELYLEIIREMISRGAEGVILGCTEIPLLIKKEDVSVPVFDTTRIHAEGAVLYALK